MENWQIEWVGQVLPEELDQLLRHYRVMPKWMQDSVPATVNFAHATEIGLFHLAEDRNAGIFIETKTPDPSVRLLQFVSPKRNPKTLKPAFRELAADLHQRWFESLSLSRVEALVAIRRTRIISTLKGLGFKCETYPGGVRGGIDFGKGREPYCILGLIPGDKPPPDYSMIEKPVEDCAEGASSPEPELEPVAQE